MRFIRLPSRLAGFMAYVDPEDRLPLTEVGEVWARSDWQVPSHVNEGWEVHYQHKGSSRWMVGKEIHTVPEKGLYLIRRGVRHRILEWMGEEAHFFYAVFPEKIVPAVLQKKFPWNKNYFFHGNAHALEILFQELIREVSLISSWRGEVCRSYLQLICYELSRLMDQKGMEPNLEAHPAALLAKEVMEKRPEAPWKLSQLSRVSGVSIPHLMDVFKKEFGVSPKKFLLLERLRIAKKRLISSDQAITQIALDLGFSSSQHFSAAFRDQYRVSPRRCRSQFFRRTEEPSFQIPSRR